MWTALHRSAAMYLSGICFCAASATFAPSSRSLVPISIFKTTGNVVVADAQWLGPTSPMRLTGPSASVTYDFGQMVAGIPSLKISNSTCGGGSCVESSSTLPSLTCGPDCQGLGVAYTESALFVAPTSDKTVYYLEEDGTVFLPLDSNDTSGAYSIPPQWSRGSFRYLTLSLGNSTSESTAVTVAFDSLYYNASPNVPSDKLQQYTGHFDSSDPLLNQIWQAGAYTLQLCTITANSSVQHLYILDGHGWGDNTSARGLESGEVFLADGAKRDRNPWAGDLSISLRSALVSQNYDNLLAIRNVLRECIILQDTNITSPTYGYFPYAGSPFGDLLVLAGKAFGIPPYGSDTYHLWTIAGYVDYVLVSDDQRFAATNWQSMVVGLEATYSRLDSETGLFNSTGTLDWGRIGQGGQNIAVNALYYYTLQQMVHLSQFMNTSTTTVETWMTVAERVKTSANQHLFDPVAGLYRDNTTDAGSRVHPQDGNSFAVRFGLTKSSAQARAVVDALATRQNDFGSLAPEAPGNISPFITSHQLAAHFMASPGEAAVPMALIRKQWGYMLNKFSNSTMIEAYAADGSLNYTFYPNGSAFISHAHGWSTGPMYNLIHDILGLYATRLDTDMTDGDWAFKPTVSGSGLTFAEGGFNTTAGHFAARWRMTSSGNFMANLTAPADTNGTVYVPTFGHDTGCMQVTLDSQTQYSLDEVPNEPYVRLRNIKSQGIAVAIVASYAV